LQASIISVNLSLRPVNRLVRLLALNLIGSISHLGESLHQVGTRRSGASEALNILVKRLHVRVNAGITRCPCCPVSQSFKMGIIYSTLSRLVRRYYTPTSNEKDKVASIEWIHIPDTLARWPWPRAINPYYEECEAESDAGFQGFNVYSPRAQAAFNRCQFGKR
jgi:hypothetical protein